MISPNDYKEVPGTGFLCAIKPKCGDSVWYSIGWDGPDMKVYGDGDSYYDAPRWETANPETLCLLLEAAVNVVDAYNCKDTERMTACIQEMELHLGELSE